MPKTITITIHEPYLKTLTEWASVSRTLSTASNACEAAASPQAGGAEGFISDTDQDIYRFCEKELEQLTPALDHLHKQTQAQLWYPRRLDTRIPSAVYKGEELVGLGIAPKGADDRILRQFNCEENIYQVIDLTPEEYNTLLDHPKFKTFKLYDLS